MVASESLTRVVLDERDVGGGLALSDASGWNQTAEDWKLFLRHGHVSGCRADSGEIVATGAALPYDGGQGWVSMVLVTPSWRHRGLATALLGECVAHLRSAGIVPVLDATPAGEPVYRRIGFGSGFGFERWEAQLPAASQVAVSTEGATPGSGAEATVRDPDVRAAVPDDLETIAALDAAATRVGRRVLIEAFLARPDTRAWITRDGAGFVIARAGRRATQVGPLVAADEGQAIALLDAAFAALSGPVFLDVPGRWGALIDWLKHRGFRSQRPFLRMALGDAPALACSERQFVVAGPEFG